MEQQKLKENEINGKYMLLFIKKTKTIAFYFKRKNYQFSIKKRSQQMPSYRKPFTFKIIIKKIKNSIAKRTKQA